MGGGTLIEAGGWEMGSITESGRGRGYTAGDKVTKGYEEKADG